MSSARISVNVDEEVKQGAQRVFSEIGIDMTTAIDSFLRTVVREERIPFNLQTKQAYRDLAHRDYIRAELAKAEREAADPDTVWLSHEDIMARAAARREARGRV